jgi:hypothetical protein
LSIVLDPLDLVSATLIYQGLGFVSSLFTYVSSGKNF